MTVHERLTALADYPDEADVMVSLFRADGTILALPIDGVDEDAGVVHIETAKQKGSSTEPGHGLSAHVCLRLKRRARGG